MQKPKLPESFFNPSVQPVSLMERDDWFVPVGEGLKEEKAPTIQDISPRHEKVKKVIKTILIILGVAAFLVLGYYFYRDFMELDFSYVGFF